MHSFICPDLGQLKQCDSVQSKKMEMGGNMGVFRKELKKTSLLAAPMVMTTLLQYLMQVVSLMMVGHLGRLPLSAVAIATALTNVSGFSLLVSILILSCQKLCILLFEQLYNLMESSQEWSGGLETLCGQAYGAQQYHKLGNYTYSAIISLALVCVPIGVLWIFMDKLLILIGQDPLISLEARKYSVWLIPGLFGCAVLKPTVRYLQTQSLILPFLISSLFFVSMYLFVGFSYLSWSWEIQGQQWPSVCPTGIM